jgi:hypothetical protein
MTPTIELLPETREYRYAAGSYDRPDPEGSVPPPPGDAVLIEDWSTRFYVNEVAAFLSECGQLPVSHRLPGAESRRAVR